MLQNFLTHSAWDYRGVMDQVAGNAAVWHLIARGEVNSPATLKYSVSNAPAQTSAANLTKMQAQCFWIEPAFQDAKSQVGVAQYQLCDGPCRMARFTRAVPLLWPRVCSAETYRSLDNDVSKPVDLMGIHRPRSSSAFDEADRRRAALFLPHLERAITLWQLIQLSELRHQLALEALRHSYLGVILVSAAGRLLYANANAEEWLRTGAGLRVHQGNLVARHPDDNQRLRELIHAASGGIAALVAAGGWMAVRSSAGALEASVFIAPFRTATAGDSATRAVLFVRPVHRRIVLAQIAQIVFSLTATEARIAEALVNGATVEEIARNHGAKLATVRKQLKALLHKMGVRRQAEGVALLLRTIAPS